MKKLEKLRKKIINTYIISIVTGLILYIIIIIIISIRERNFLQNANAYFHTDFHSVHSYTPPLYCFYLLIFFVVLEIAVIKISTKELKKEYREKYKGLFVVWPLKSLFTEVVYDMHKGISSETIDSTNMMYMGDRYHSEDFVSAKYKNIKFEQSDVHIEREYTTTDSRGHTTTHWVTIFEGRWIIFDFNKKFTTNLSIVQKGFKNSKSGKWFWNDLEKVEMESENFNQKFKVFAENAHEAFYIITPQFMNKIENVCSNCWWRCIFCFVNNKLHIGINDWTNSFEPDGYFKKIDKNHHRKKVTKEIKMITQFVDDLNLDHVLFI